MESECKIDSVGNKFWYLDGELHREDGPAYEGISGDKEWFIDGELHREDGPACEYFNGTKKWYLYGNQYTEKAIHLHHKKKEKLLAATNKMCSKKQETQEPVFCCEDIKKYMKILNDCISKQDLDVKKAYFCPWCGKRIRPDGKNGNGKSDKGEKLYEFC